MLKVRDVMTPGVFTLEMSASAFEAKVALTRRNIGGAPVKDDAGQLTGFLSKSDLIDPEPELWIKKEATVGDLMNPDVETVYADDPAMSAVKHMAERHHHHVMVVDTEGELVGILSALDVVAAIARGARFDLDDEDEHGPQAVRSAAG